MQNRLSPAVKPCCQRSSIFRDVGVAFRDASEGAEMIVCSCNVFSDHQVRSVIAKDARRPRMSEVYSGLGCRAQCGRCAHTIKRILDDTPASVHANASMH
jgi:bacterioferritin-associated ferredoxin